MWQKDKILEVDGLSVRFVTGEDEVIAVSDVKFTLARGQRLGIVGESGSGKTITSLSILQLLRENHHAVTEGLITYLEDGANLRINSAKEDELCKMRGRKIAMIFQEPMSSLNPVIRCGKQVIEVMQVHNLHDPKERKRITLNLFHRVALDEPDRIFNSYPHELSGGQLQRVNIAMALAGNPDILICDEPTTALDVTVQKDILILLKKLSNESGISLLFVSHDLEVIAELCDSVIVMHDGRIVESGILPDIFENPGHPYTKALLMCKPRFEYRDKVLPTVSKVISGDFNYQKRKLFGYDEKSQLILEVQSLSVRFPVGAGIFGTAKKHVVALDDVSFDLRDGEILGIVGESGSGKSTIANCIAGLITPDAGQIKYRGKPLSPTSLNKDSGMRRSIQLVFQDPYSSLNPSMTIGTAIAEPLKYHNIVQGKGPVRDRVISLLRDVGLNESYFDRYPHELSGGQRQRASIARALAVEPNLMLCDESVSALDVSVQAQILNLLDDLRTAKGISLIFISHDLSVVHYLCDRILVLYRGKIVEQGAATDVLESPVAVYTKNLIASIPGSKPDTTSKNC